MSFDLPEEEAPRRKGLLLRLIKDQRIAFLIVGGVNTVVGFVLFVAVDRTLGQWVDGTFGTVAGSLSTLFVAHILGVLSAFVLYRRFVFKVEGHVWRDLGRFESVYLTSLGINAVALPLVVEWGMTRIVAQAVITVALAIISYFGHRHFSFRRKAEA
ncbi:GtrA family protein [Demequina lutea]|uniref:Putative flippase GtrA n=1 Tax=Demequina lutea TaxID=431489 RepID=A0A7Y9ZD88_9MICO|nr:GtrA family protein [Demequina lutea]NYI42453.1 putative flippase GtrA [Demequina lutea]